MRLPSAPSSNFIQSATHPSRWILQPKPARPFATYIVGVNAGVQLFTQPLSVADSVGGFLGWAQAYQDLSKPVSAWSPLAHTFPPGYPRHPAVDCQFFHVRSWFSVNGGGKVDHMGGSIVGLRRWKTVPPAAFYIVLLRPSGTFWRLRAKSTHAGSGPALGRGGTNFTHLSRCGFRSAKKYQRSCREMAGHCSAPVRILPTGLTRQALPDSATRK